MKLHPSAWDKHDERGEANRKPSRKGQEWGIRREKTSSHKGQKDKFAIRSVLEG